MANPYGYGVDVQVLGELPDPEVSCSGSTNRAYAIGRRLTTPSGALDEIGEEDYLSIDLRALLGQRVTAQEIRNLEQAASQAIEDDETVDSATVSLTFAGRRITATIAAIGAAGPFDLVLAISDVSIAVLRST